ncbi:MAG: cytochrome P450 [Acidobacteria bacterium]|nr:cytochrome P450 [Acidobacteriota bacterium]
MLSKLRRLLNSGFRHLSSASTVSRVASSSPRERPRLLFAFHGGNKTRPGMGQQFYREEAAFRQTIQRCSATVERCMGFSLSDVFEGRDSRPANSPEETERRNIVILSALELALCDLWQAYGVEPEAAVGISGGEIASVLKLLWDAGTVTTSMLIATSALLLLRHPRIKAEAQRNLRVLPTFIDEALRFEAPDQLASRVTREDVELSGVVIPAGANVKLCLGAANRDPEHFTEPESLSLQRNPNPHLASSAGPHYCLGAFLARMEARVALETLLTVWPNFTAARPLSTVSYVESIQFRALKYLFVKAA